MTIGLYKSSIDLMFSEYWIRLQIKLLNFEGGSTCSTIQPDIISIVFMNALLFIFFLSQLIADLKFWSNQLMREICTIYHNTWKLADLVIS